VTQDVHLLESERVTHRRDLDDKAVHHPRGRIVWMVGLPTAELVIEDGWAAGVGQAREVFQVVVRETTVEHQQRRAAALPESSPRCLSSLPR